MPDNILHDWPTDWKKALERDEFKCVYCGLDGSRDFNAFRQLIPSGLDHLVPKSVVADDHLNNRVVCCCACKYYKANYNPRRETDAEINDPDTLRKVRIGRVQEYLRSRTGADNWVYHANVMRALGLNPEAPSAMRIPADKLERLHMQLDHAGEHDQAIAILDKIEKIIEYLVRSHANSIDDIIAKAKATAWAIEHSCDLLDPTTESSANSRLAASIIRDLLELKRPLRDAA